MFYIKIEDLKCYDYEVFSRHIVETYDYLNNLNGIDFPEIAIVCKDYTETRMLIKELLIEGLEVASIDIKPPYYSNCYECEYYICINWDGIFVEPSKNKYNNYKLESCDILFISNDANSKILNYIDTGIAYAYDINN